jgi:CubicO group peptidase (beta-lactamase class C family)
LISLHIIICDFGNGHLQKTAYRYPAVVTAYIDNDAMIQLMPQVIFGALPARGSLPYSISTRFHEGLGIGTSALGRLTYSIPEDAEVDGRVLGKIDSIAREAIDIHGTPGCQVFVARHGKVIYNKCFGHLTYDGKDKVTSNTIYDLASVTKVSATLQTAMFMYDHGLLDLHKKVSTYLPEMKKTNKKDITVIDMLTHQSGLVPFIPMYNSTVKDTTFLPLYYNRVQSEKYPLHVANRLYASTNLRDSVWSWVLKSKMNEKPARTPYSFKYSDLGFMILQHIAERLLNQPMDDFLQQNLYEPLGATTLGFNPLTRFEQSRIAPTEDDKIYRRTSVAGTVHDERAAMLGGVSGHAGLFGTANDMGKLCQMWLQNGSYGGYQYFKPETIRLFTGRKFKTSHRGIGWDKPVQGSTTGSTSVYASPLTFGHTGFTGTCIWIDPEFDLVYIFLSNRVYPDRSTKLINANIRSRIQDVIYRSIFSYQALERPKFILAREEAIKGDPIRPLE